MDDPHSSRLQSSFSKSNCINKHDMSSIWLNMSFETIVINFKVSSAVKFDEPPWFWALNLGMNGDMPKSYLLHVLVITSRFPNKYFNGYFAHLNWSWIRWKRRCFTSSTGLIGPWFALCKVTYGRGRRTFGFFILTQLFVLGSNLIWIWITKKHFMAK